MNETSHTAHEGLQSRIGFGPNIHHGAKSIDEIPQLLANGLATDDSEIGCTAAEFAETLRSLPDL